MAKVPKRFEEMPVPEETLIPVVEALPLELTSTPNVL
jgi:hypothetical protein